MAKFRLDSEVPFKISGSRIFHINGYYKLLHPNKESIQFMNEYLTAVTPDKWQLSIEGIYRTLEKIFNGKLVYIIGCGKTLEKIRRWHFIKDSMIICINDSYRYIEPLNLEIPIFGCHLDTVHPDAYIPQSKKVLTVSGTRKIHKEGVEYYITPRLVRGNSFIYIVNLLKIIKVKTLRCVGFDAFTTKNLDYASNVINHKKPEILLNQNANMLKIIEGIDTLWFDGEKFKTLEEFSI